MGAVGAGFLFRAQGIEWPDALMYLGFAVIGAAFLAFSIRFSPKVEAEAKIEFDKALAEKELINEKRNEAAFDRLRDA